MSQHIITAKKTEEAQSPAEAVLAAYMKDVGRYPLMTPDEEKQRAEHIVTLRASYWRAILSHPPYLPALVEVVQAEEALEADGDARALLTATLAAAEALKIRRTVAHRAELDDAIKRLSQWLAMADAECLLADRIAADLETLGHGERRGVSLSVKPPREGSKPFAAYLGTVRRAAAALTAERHYFARANLRLVVRMAHRHRNSGLSVPDLVQDGNIGLLKAVDRFDPGRGFRFSTYASWWIRHHIRRAIVNRGRTIRLPQHLHTLQNKLATSRRELQTLLGRDPIEQELAEHAGTTVEKVQLVAEAGSTRALSLDARASDDDPRPVVDLLAAPEDRAPGEQLDLERAAARLQGAMLELDPMSRDILRQRFGLDGGEPRTLAEIGTQYSLSRERIRQLQVVALRRMKEHLDRVPMRS